MEFGFRNCRKSDGKVVIDIFNYFVKESNAAYCEKTVELDWFENKFDSAKVFIVIENIDRVIGFGYISPYNQALTFNHVGMLTYFIMPGFTGMGLGSKMLKSLEKKAKEMGIFNLVAHISSENIQSRTFHEKKGFKQCGELKKMFKKNGEFINIVWVQKFI